MNHSLEGQVVFITGGSSGIGKAGAKRFAEMGLKVAICARREDKLNSAVQELKTISNDVLGLQMDISKADQVRQGINRIHNELGPIDILINNAGIYRWGNLIDTTIEEFDQQMDINLKGAFLVTQAVLPGMIERKKGRIIFVSSTITLESPPMNTVYNACKFGIEGWAGCLAQEVIDDNINVHTLRPGFTATDVFNEIEKPPIDPDWIDPDEFAKVFEFLCTLPQHAQVPELSYMTTFQRKEY